MLQNDYFLVKIGFDTAENAPRIARDVSRPSPEFPARCSNRAPRLLIRPTRTASAVEANLYAHLSSSVRALFRSLKITSMDLGTEVTNSIQRMDRFVGSAAVQSLFFMTQNLALPQRARVLDGSTRNLDSSFFKTSKTSLIYSALKRKGAERER